jgi:hypothetical protein
MSSESAQERVQNAVHEAASENGAGQNLPAGVLDLVLQIELNNQFSTDRRPARLDLKKAISLTMQQSSEDQTL